MKKLLTFLLALTLLFSLFACNSTGEEDGQENGDSNQNGETAQTSGDLSRIDKIKQEGTLRIGTSADYPPYEFHTEIDGVDTIVGFDIALCQYIADDLGVELEITDMSFDSLLISLQQDKFDIVAAGMSPDEERLKAADFTDKIFESEQSIILRKADVALYPTTAELAHLILYHPEFVRGKYNTGFLEDHLEEVLQWDCEREREAKWKRISASAGRGSSSSSTSGTALSGMCPSASPPRRCSASAPPAGR